MRYRRLASVTLNVSDAARSRRFYAALPGEGAGIEVSQGAAAGLKRFAFEAEDAATLERLGAAFDRLGVRWTPCTGGISFVEPHMGVAVQILLDAGPPHALGHLVIRAAQYRESVEFWREVMGFRLSDEIDGRMSFLRCFPNPQHHSLAIVNGERNAFHHLNFRAQTSDDVGRLAHALAERSAPILCGPALHTPTGSRFVFFLDPDGLTVEISAGTEHFDEHAPRPPRLLPDRPESFDDGTSPRDPRMFKVGAIEVAMA